MVLVWWGRKLAENELNMTLVFEQHLSLGENSRIQKRAFSACLQAENIMFKNPSIGLARWVRIH